MSPSRSETPMTPRYPFLLTLLVLLTSPAVAQVTTGRPAAARPPTKDRVIAEALSSLQPGNFYLVLERAYPFTVVGAYESVDSARAAVAGDMAPRYEVSGPHRSTGARTPWHVVSVQLRVRGSDGREQNVEYDARSVDAIFLSMPAVDKFVVPYYARVYGRPYADSIRAILLGGGVPGGGLPSPPCHRYSFMCWPKPMF